jgi:hypothetical protein
MNGKSVSRLSVLVLVLIGAVAGFATPLCAQAVEPDPYDGFVVPYLVESPSGLPTGDAAPDSIPACPTQCFQLQWVQLSNVIDVTGFGAGVEGASAGVLMDPNDGKRKIYVSHGYSFFDRSVLRIYDISTDTWSLGTAAMVARSEGTGAAVGGKLYVIGGRNVPKPMEVFDPTGAGSWVLGPPMPAPRAGLGAAVLAGKIHVVGGRLGNGPLDGPGVPTHDIFDPIMGTWGARAPLPVPTGDNYSTAALAGRLFVMGGWNGMAHMNANQVYTDATDTWALGAPMPTSRSNGIAGPLGGRVIAIGGEAFLGTSTAVEAYDPVFDTWCVGPAKPRAASEMASVGVVAGNAIYAIGSGIGGANQNFHEALVLTKVDCECPFTQGYWKNHPDDWPLTGMVLGAQFYTMMQLLDLFDTSPKGDASVILAHQLIAAKLNYANGADRPDPVTEAILDADALLAGFPGMLPYGVKPSKNSGPAMISLANLLDHYNEGEFAPECYE